MVRGNTPIPSPHPGSWTQQSAGWMKVMGGFHNHCTYTSAQRVKFCLSFVPLLLTFPDIDECSGGHTCDSSATCHNTDGSYTCVCDSGYGGDGYTCRGIVLDQLLRPQLFVSILKIIKVLFCHSFGTQRRRISSWLSFFNPLLNARTRRNYHTSLSKRRYS